MTNYLVRNIQIVDSGKIFTADLLVRSGRFFRIGSNLKSPDFKVEEINGEGKFLLPGIIDAHVHFREPGLTYKADISSESGAAIAGGVTSFIEMPNTIPNTTTQERLEEKFRIAAATSVANYSFYIGATNDNFNELAKAAGAGAAGIKVFLGSSTGNMLVSDEKSIEKIFSESGQLLVIHAEDEDIIRKNTEIFRQKYGDNIPMEFHPRIRPVEACVMATSEALRLARKYNSRVHIAHLSTADECLLFDNELPLSQKKITCETGIQYLNFDSEQYKLLGSKIKCNPAIKEAKHKTALLNALNDNHIDLLASDHAPHTAEEKNQPYTHCPSGIPLVQHSLPFMLELFRDRKISLETLVEKMCHAPAISHKIAERGFIKESFKADFVIVDLNKDFTVNSSNIKYKCGWSPFEGQKFHSEIDMVFVNGVMKFNQGNFCNFIPGEKLHFE